MGTPIINLPQTGRSFGILSCCSPVLTFFLAVLGLHAIKDKPVAVNGKVEIRPVSTFQVAVATCTSIVWIMLTLCCR